MDLAKIIPKPFGLYLIKRQLQVFKYLAVTGFNFLSHQIILWLANSVWGWNGHTSNFFAGTIVAVPAYLLSRYWVWEVSGKNSIKNEIVPFWSIAILGLIVSTIFTWRADAMFESHIMIHLASLVAYFLIWVLKFILLDRIFRTATIKGHFKNER